MDSAANPKNFPKKQFAQSVPPNPNGPQNPKQNGPQNPKNQIKNQRGPPESRQKNDDQKPRQQAQPGNKLEKPQPTAPFNQIPKERKPKVQNQANNGGPPSQPQGEQFGQGKRNKTFNNGPNNANNVDQQRAPKNNGSNDASVPAEKPANNKFILMVGGLPGKMDFKILKENLQLQANKVNGKVKYVKNGQAFITFNNKGNADRAVELFNGKKVFGKSLNVCFTNNIPFENPAEGKPKSGNINLSRKTTRI